MTRVSLKSMPVSVWRHWAVREARRTFGLAWPIGLSLFLQQMIFTVSLAFAGHIEEANTVVLEAVGLSVSVTSVVALTLGFGMCAALDTLATQAWGAKNYKKLGVYVQRAILVLGLVALLVFSVWFNMESLLHLLQQPPCVVGYTVQYMQVAMSFIPALFLYTILQRYLQAQNIVYPFVLTGLVANAVNALAHYLFLFVAGWGVKGAAAAVSLALYTQLFILLAIIYVRRLHVKTWGGWSRECLQDWGQFARYGIPGFVMLFAEWAGFELGFLLTGIVSSTQQTIYTLVGNWITLLYMIPTSIQIASSIRIGNEIGAGNPELAKKACIVGLGLLSVWVASITVVNFSLRSAILRMFTSNEDILSLLNLPMVATAVFVAVDHVDSFLGGILRGLGRQALGAAGNTVAFWLVGIPLGIGLLFGTELGAVSYIIGLIVAAFLQLLVYVVVIVATDWRKQSMKARRMADADDKGSSGEVEGGVCRGPSHSAVEDSDNMGDVLPLALDSDVESELPAKERSVSNPHKDSDNCSFASGVFGKDSKRKNVLSSVVHDEVNKCNGIGNFASSCTNGNVLVSPPSLDERQAALSTSDSATKRVTTLAEPAPSENPLHGRVGRMNPSFSVAPHDSRSNGGVTVTDTRDDDALLHPLDSEHSNSDTEEEEKEEFRSLSPTSTEQQFLISDGQDTGCIQAGSRDVVSESNHQQQPPRQLTKTTLTIRLATVLFFVLLLLLGIVLSQLYVYRPSVCIADGDGYNTTNSTTNLTTSEIYFLRNATHI